jgi:hypothetical protein
MTLETEWAALSGWSLQSFLTVRECFNDRTTEACNMMLNTLLTVTLLGRVEEKVLGVKGSDCTKITEAINAQLGKVVSTTPTEEMFEQSLRQDETLYDTDTSSTW